MVGCDFQSNTIKSIQSKTIRNSEDYPIFKESIDRVYEIMNKWCNFLKFNYINIMIEYIPILVFLLFALSLSVGAFLLSIILGKKASYPEKDSTYECGFEPFDQTRGKFEVKFYLVAI